MFSREVISRKFGSHTIFAIHKLICWDTRKMETKIPRSDRHMSSFGPKTIIPFKRIDADVCGTNLIDCVWSAANEKAVACYTITLCTKKSEILYFLRFMQHFIFIQALFTEDKEAAKSWWKTRNRTVDHWKSNVVEVQSPLIKFLWNPNLYFSALKALRGFKFRKMDPFLGETNGVGATK